MSDFNDPRQSTGIQWADLKGSLLLIKPFEQLYGVKTSYGEADAVRADVIVLDGDEADTVYADTLIFPKLLQSAVRPFIADNGMVLGRLGQGVKKQGQSPPWTLSAATEDDKVIGRAHLDKNKVTPF